MKIRKFWKRILLTLLVVLVATDLTLWWNAKVPLSDRLYRVVSGAPEIHLDGALLYYEGRLDNSAVVEYRPSDEGLYLYKSFDIPDGQVPPYYYKLGMDNFVGFKYSKMHRPFGMQ
ncbi:hypothetical protein JJB07_18315 [Tumebacillus sp. ITR2]|uniref:Uncharacterized protein n=1 Tax=Tumebacillus amylolyticus TaxID=2801339 RepID=A0ABS1JE40_9BACL|nr:hypothetical protein [Tumebacillus amylolyticus]MBL0388562.1 hypothetical protein [Tumebacillus amylolyticus]